MGTGSRDEAFDRARVLSRRALIASTGAAALGAAIGGSMARPDRPAASEGDSLPFADSAEVDDTIGYALREAVGEYPLALPKAAESAVISIDFTDPRSRLTLELSPGHTTPTTQSRAEATSGVVLSALTAHELLKGQISAAFALANDRIVLVGNRRELAPLLDLCSAAKPCYRRRMDETGKRKFMTIDTKEIL